MITKQVIQKAQEQAYLDSETYGAPSKFHIDLSVEQAKRLSKMFNADENIVILGAYFMDCMLGYAFSEGILSEHVSVSHNKAKEILDQDQDITREEKQNVVACVQEHHGSDGFYSLESEICCNADCYRFASVKGFLGGIIDFGDMPLDKLVELYSEKAYEKWNAISLDVVRKELEPQYKAVRELLALYS